LSCWLPCLCLSARCSLTFARQGPELLLTTEMHAGVITSFVDDAGGLLITSHEDVSMCARQLDVRMHRALAGLSGGRGGGFGVGGAPGIGWLAGSEAQAPSSLCMRVMCVSRVGGHCTTCCGARTWSVPASLCVASMYILQTLEPLYIAFTPSVCVAIEVDEKRVFIACQDARLYALEKSVGGSACHPPSPTVPTSLHTHAHLRRFLHLLPSVPHLYPAPTRTGCTVR
jgi:hypothetical protein